MKGANQRIIYVGKAKNLRQRVRQYFNGHDERYQIRFLLKRLEDVDFLETHNEKEALLLENSLIKKHKPRYNVFLKDDKTYQGLKITIKSKFPRLMTTRKIKRDGSLYYGPFTSSDSLRQVKAFIDQFFQLRTCSDHELHNRTRPCLEYQIKRCSAPCVNYVSKKDYHQQIQEVQEFLSGKNKSLQKHIRERMWQASKQENFEEASRLRDLLSSMDSVLEGQKVTHLSFDFIDVLALERHQRRVGVAVLMVREAMLMDSVYYNLESLEDDEHFLHNFITQYYSENAFLPKEIVLPFQVPQKQLLETLLSERAKYRVKITHPTRGKKHDLIKLAKQNLKSQESVHRQKVQQTENALEELQKRLLLTNYPERMECYDISNISGKYAVASMVTFVSGEPFKNGYRRFKIQTIDSPNDFAMMTEVLKRRFAKKKTEWAWPDVIVVDGGKGQLSVALKVLEELNITGIDVVAVAKGQGKGVRAKGEWEGKKQEEIYLANRKNPVTFKAKKKALMILQNLRDESHRFAINYHRKLRDQV